MAGDVQSYLQAAPWPRRPAEVGRDAASAKPAWPILLAVLIAHVCAVYWTVRQRLESREADVGRTIAVRLIDPPEARQVIATPAGPDHSHRVRAARHSGSAIPADAPAPSISSAAPDALIFNPDGSLHLPLEKNPGKGIPAPDVAKGRELMGRGLDCEAPDALGTGESLGEETARRYLSWIGLYNPYAAQRRAELLEERKARCRRWRGES